MKVGLLGPLRVTRREEEVPVRGTKQRALIAILALRRGSAVAAERLIDLLWGEDLPVNPQNALQAQVATARRTLGAEAIETVGASYALRFDVSGSEVPEFERLAADGRAAAEAGDWPTAAERLTAALGLWRGPALADFAYDGWARPEITRLEELRAAAVDARIDAELTMGRDADLVGEIEALLAEDRFREHRWAQLMLALYRSGRQADALRAASEARRTLVEELGVDPGPELVQLEAQILNHDVEPAVRGAAVVAEASRPPLPAPLTRFFGREGEVAAIGEMLATADARLVTLVGPGGAGKTRLALELTRRIAVEGGVDASFVALESVAGDDAVVSAVAAAVGLRRDSPTGATGTDAVRAVASLIADRRWLVVLDNCEHVVAEAARVAEALLSACTNLTVVATSREALAIAGERIVPVGPLDRAAAAELFVDRARSVRSDVDVDAAAPAVGQICERLDGLPLAVELAAARAKALPVGQIAERLAHRFRLLTGGARTATPRQQTLRAVVDWSYDLLFDDERELFARLSVFSGGWTLDAAEEVCGDEALPSSTVLDLLTALLDKSLVVAEARGPTLRYRMLQTLSEYAQEKLAERGDAAAHRDRHAQWFLDLGLRAGSGLTSRDALHWRAVLEDDLDNVRAAFDWLCESGRSRDALELAGAVALLWWLRGDWAEGQRWADQAARTAGDVPDDLRAINEAWGAFYGANNGGDPAEAVSACRAAVARLDAIGDPQLRARAHVVLATLLSRQRDASLDDAAARAIEAAAADGDPWFHGVAHALMALYRVRTGALDDAAESADRSVELLESVGDRAVVFEARSVLVTVAQLAGRLDDAEALLEDMSNAACEAQVRHYEEWCCTRLGFVRTARGDVEGGAELHRSALAIGADPWADAHAHLGLAVCARRCGDAASARVHCDLALAIHRRVGAQIEQAYMHVIRAWTELDAGDPDEAGRRADLAEAAVDGPSAPSITAMAAEVRAAVAAAAGKPDEARGLLARAHELAPVVGHAAWWLTRPDVAAVAEQVGAPTG